MLINLRHGSADQMLAKGHAKTRGCGRIVLFLLGQIDPGIIRVGREQQQMVLAMSVDEKSDFIVIGLIDLSDFAADEGLLKLKG